MDEIKDYTSTILLKRMNDKLVSLHRENARLKVILNTLSTKPGFNQVQIELNKLINVDEFDPESLGVKELIDLEKDYVPRSEYYEAIARVKDIELYFKMFKQITKVGVKSLVDEYIRKKDEFDLEAYFEVRKIKKCSNCKRMKQKIDDAFNYGRTYKQMIKEYNKVHGTNIQKWYYENKGKELNHDQVFENLSDVNTTTQGTTNRNYEASAEAYDAGDTKE